jgi:hypothetical protein
MFLAMAHQRLGQHGESRKWLEKARSWLDDAKNQEPGAKGGVSWKGLPWTDRVLLDALMREAEQLVKGAEK